MENTQETKAVSPEIFQRTDISWQELPEYRFLQNKTDFQLQIPITLLLIFAIPVVGYLLYMNEERIPAGLVLGFFMLIFLIIFASSRQSIIVVRRNNHTVS